MAGNIKGITITFRGETTELEKAVKKVDKEVAKVDDSLGKVKKALKFSPSSVELWRQKQVLLNEKIVATKDKLNALKDAQKKIDADDSVDKQSKEYMNLRREIVETESKLKTFKGQLREIGNYKLKALSQSLKKIGDKMTKIGKTMTTTVTAPIVAGYTLASSYASDYEENLNKIDVAFGKNAESVKAWAETAAEQFGLSKVQATDAASSFGALAKGIGLSDDTAADMSTNLAGLSADLGSYFNVGVDESAKALEGIFTGEAEALKKFGVVMNDVNLKAFAKEQGKIFDEMTQGEKTTLRYQFVLAKTADAQGDFARTSDGTANSTKILQASIQDLATGIGTQLLPIITPVIQGITNLLKRFNALPPETQRIITVVGLAAAAAGPLLVAIGSIITAVGTITGAVGGLGTALTFLGSPIGLIIGLFAALVAGGLLVYNNWDFLCKMADEIGKQISASWEGVCNSVSSFMSGLAKSLSNTWSSIRNNAITAWNNLKNTASNTWGKIKAAITKPIEDAKNKIKQILDTVKGFFPLNIGKLIDGIKLPHFNLSGSFDLKKGQVPSLNVDWYKTGGIFDSPSIIGVGEAGAEAVLPLDTLWKKLDAIAAGGGGMTVNVYGSAGMSVEDLAAAVEQRIIKMQKRRAMAWS